MQVELLALGNLLLTSVTAISGVQAPAPLSLSNCNPTTGSNYTVTHIDGISSSPLQTGGMPYTEFVVGITPVLTILQDPSTSDPETHLTCLKVMTTSSNTASQLESSSSSVAPFEYTAMLIVGVLSLWMMI